MSNPEDYIADSTQSGANLVAPAGATIIVGIVPPAGWYEIRFCAFTGAGSVAADNGNVRLLANGSTIVNGVPTNGAQQVLPRIQCNGTNAVQLTTIGAATAAVVYTANLIITRIG